MLSDANVTETEIWAYSTFTPLLLFLSKNKM